MFTKTQLERIHAFQEKSRTQKLFFGTTLNILQSDMRAQNKRRVRTPGNKRRHVHRVTKRILKSP